MTSAIYRISGIKDCKLTTAAGADIDVPYANLSNLTPEFEEIVFEGDGEQVKDYYGYRLNGELAFDKWSEEIIEALYGKTAVEAALPSGEAKRYYMGSAEDLAPVQHQLTIDYNAIDDDTEAAATVRVIIFKARMAPYAPPSGATAAKFGPHTFTFTSEKTSTDIEDAALPGVPTGGAHYAISVLS
jgi:hypothetical protein